jgi:stress-induced morphogen
VPSPDEIKQRIEAAVPGSLADVQDTTGTGDHFRATVTSQAFDGLSRIAQHRLVYSALEADIGGAIHALALKTVPAPAAAVPAGGEEPASTQAPTP